MKLNWKKVKGCQATKEFSVISIDSKFKFTLFKALYHVYPGIVVRVFQLVGLGVRIKGHGKTKVKCGNVATFVPKNLKLPQGIAIWALTLQCFGPMTPPPPPLHPFSLHPSSNMKRNKLITHVLDQKCTTMLSARLLWTLAVKGKWVFPLWCNKQKRISF